MLFIECRGGRYYVGQERKACKLRTSWPLPRILIDSLIMKWRVPLFVVTVVVIGPLLTDVAAQGAEKVRLTGAAVVAVHYPRRLRGPVGARGGEARRMLDGNGSEGSQDRGVGGRFGMCGPRLIAADGASLLGGGSR